MEMATGEGKTLALALAAVLAAWRGRACHVLTANDYLAGRDAAGYRRFYARCGLSVAAVVGGQGPAERRAAHGAEVVYTTSRELVGDFLRDRLRVGRRVTAAAWRPWLRRSPEKRPMVTVPRLDTVLVDEADHVLIDEAVTPLIISAPRENAWLADLCRAALAEARGLRKGSDYTINAARREARVDRRVTLAVERGEHELMRVPRWREEWLGKALRALHAHEAGKHYFVREEKVVLIDESTGRPTPERSLGEGLHALLEAKEGLRVGAPTETLASLSFQRFFRQVPRLGGLTGTGWDARAEFWRLYRLPVVVLPRHRALRRRRRAAVGCGTEAEKWGRVVEIARECRERGQPVLIGTRTVAASEAVAAALREAGVAFALLNAVRDADEAGIVAAAGQAGQVTIATNMAGRGTDIVPDEQALAAGGLRVIATERHGSRRVDRQLAGRSGRQGQPGEVEPMMSWEDEVLRHFLPERWRRAGQRWGGRGWVLRLSLAWAQWRSGRREARRRLGVLQQDQWLDEHLSLGTATPESRRRNTVPVGQRWPVNPGGA